MTCSAPHTAPALAAVAAGGLAILASLAAPAAARAAAGPWRENPQAKVRLITPYALAPAVGELRMGLQIVVAPGWHVYWKNSGDAGYPPVADFSATPELAGVELLYPAPQRYELPGGLVAFGYENEVVYPLRGRLQAAGDSAVTLTADLDYLVCEVDCIPYSVRLTAEQPLVADPLAARPDPQTAKLIAAWWERLPVPAERAVGIATRGGLDLDDPRGPTLVVDVVGDSALLAKRPDLFLEVHPVFTAGAPRLTRTASGLRFDIPLTYRELPSEPIAEADFAWTVTGLDPAGGGPAAVEATRTVAPIAPPAATDAPRSGDFVTFLLAALTVAATGLALFGWGLLGHRPTGRSAEAFGFAALAAAIGLLYALSGRVSSEGLAFIELTLLAGALVAWLSGRAAGGRLWRTALVGTLAALAVLTIWLATRSRVSAPTSPPGPAPSEGTLSSR